MLKIAVLPCEGSRLNEYEATLGRIFAAMIEDAPEPPIAFGLHDLDERDSQPSEEHGYVNRIWLNCRELENLYLTAEVLVEFECDEDQTRRKIHEQASRFGGKVEQLKSIADADWRSVNLKGTMEQLVEILDPKRVDWRVRIGQVIGKSKPTGELAERLGPQVIAAFWPAPDSVASDAE